MCSVRKRAGVHANQEGKTILRAVCPFLSHSVPGVTGSKAFAPPRPKTHPSTLPYTRTLPSSLGPQTHVSLFPANPKRGPPQVSL
jgi:hypothetical protein